MTDLISRAALIEALKSYRATLTDVILRWVVDRVIERVMAQPAVEVAPDENI